MWHLVQLLKLINIFQKKNVLSLLHLDPFYFNEKVKSWGEGDGGISYEIGKVVGRGSK